MTEVLHCLVHEQVLVKMCEDVGGDSMCLPSRNPLAIVCAAIMD